MATTTTRTIALLVVGAAIGLGLITFSYYSDIRQARDRASRGSRMAHTACGPIEYGVTGDGPPVLVVHGAGGGFDQGLEFGAPLAERGFRIIAMSRFGYLRTPVPGDASPNAQADAHACLLDTLGIETAAVVAGSAGAPSSLQFALRHPSRITALVLLVSAAYVPRPDNGPSVHPRPGLQVMVDVALQSDAFFWAMSQLARETVVRTMLATPPAVVRQAAPEEQAPVRQVLDHILPISRRRIGLLNEAAVIPSLPRYELEQITAPTLTISCADDLFGTYDSARYTAAVEQIPRARFLGYPSGGTYGWDISKRSWTRPPGFWTLLNRPSVSGAMALQATRSVAGTNEPVLFHRS